MASSSAGPSRPTETESIASEAQQHGDEPSVSSPGDSQAAVIPGTAKPETPLPKLHLAIVFLIRIAEPINFVFILPFINSYVWDLGVTRDRSRVGIYAGIIESLFAASQLFTVLHWASLSDRIGRRPVLIVGTLGLTLSAALFGFADSFAMAIFARCLTGLLNGNVALLRSIIGEVCDETNVAKGFVLLPLAWNAGASIGPLLGGFLVYPASRFPALFGNSDAPFYWDGFWLHKPYLLPCLAVACLSFASFLVTLFFLPETLPSKVAELKERERKRMESELEREEEETRVAVEPELRRRRQRAGGDREEGDDERTPLLGDRGLDTSASHASPDNRNADISTTNGATAAEPIEDDSDKDAPSSSSSWSILRIPHVRNVLFSFGILSFLSVGIEAVLVLFLYEPLHLGGLNFTPAQTGVYLGFWAIFAMVVQMLSTAYLVRRLGTNRLYSYCLLCFPVMALLLPLASAVARWGSQGHVGGEADPLPTSTMVMIYIILSIFAILRCCSAFGYVCNLLLVNECARLMPGSRLGAVNGFSTMSSCIARALSPSFCTFLFSLTVSPDRYPLFRGWLVWGVLFAIGAAASTKTLKPIEVVVAEEEARRRKRRSEVRS
ncbi:unnamed protein product [Tilletia controversa]|uniref:Major facilitator superfamily (MFS) profile domain-containing protein n=3 Tax=Tilletia TaxID=13289 RepID=A0A8X7T122_9BASI|nr:hypothetical protein CF336_g455 [Tilletia laevis]KAE8205586.1 hypothetical protein CF328_g420 [Tilletia controversa]KAE8265461.1 hypothetical protein A4X03_0g243 [Tilletia caries]KAE8208758.1 hypothetical protein CF335_g185 [Tilletia laevis]KAE8255266.1 hypothetical protein A4X06_0g516 [Tilletia controversa]